MFFFPELLFFVRFTVNMVVVAVVVFVTTGATAVAVADYTQRLELLLFTENKIFHGYARSGFNL